MAERRHLPESNLPPDPSVSSPEAKKSKLFGETESREESADKDEEEKREEKEEEFLPETTEKLRSSSSSSSTEEIARSVQSIESGKVAKSENVDRAAKNLGERDMGGRSIDEGQSSVIGGEARYRNLSKIGDGAYGTVYRAKDVVSGQVVALKKVHVPLTDNGLPYSTIREIATLKQLDRFEHPHIVKLLDVCQKNHVQLPSPLADEPERFTVWLVFEHMERDLASFMASRSSSPISPATVKQMSKEILLGVDFLHTHRILHRDLKPQNLLVSRDGRIKIADFGLAKTYDFEMRLTSVVVTLWYRAPEVLLGCPYATPVDLWSVGCILAELNTLSALFPGTSEGDQLDRIFRIIGSPSQEEWPENVSLSWTAFPVRQPKPLADLMPRLEEQGLDLIKKMLTFDPHGRLTAAQALRHEYFASTL